MKGIKRFLSLLSKNNKTASVKVNKSQDMVRPQDVARLSSVATLVSPPDPVSNLRHVKLRVPENESAAEAQFRTQYTAVQDWNQEYWTKHNTDFQRKKDEFTRRKLEEYSRQGIKKENVPAEEMAEFYRTFLNDNHQKHMQYNWTWYKKNFGLLWPAIKSNWAYYSRELQNGGFQKIR
uniref:Uncharacterized protein n=1 Tax=Ixodes ricinus TaxID=34613 RepID=A0A0K8RMP4_IXORI